MLPVLLLALSAACGGEPAPAPGGDAAPPSTEAASPASGTVAPAAAEAAADAPSDLATPGGPAPVAAVVPGPEGDAVGPELGDRPGRIPTAEELPAFQGGTVRVTIHLPRKMTGQVDFIAKDHQAAAGFRVVHAQRFTDSDTIHVNAPAGTTDELYVLVHEFPDGIPTYGPEVPKGVVPEAVRFDQDGAEYTVLWNEGVAWMADVFRPGEGEQAVDDSAKAGGAKP